MAGRKQYSRQGHARSGRGAVLATTVAVAAVLMLLVLATFVYLRSNAGTAAYQRDRIHAAYASESGINLALHHLRGMNGVPAEEFDPFAGEILLPGGSTAAVQVTPAVSGDPMTANGAVEIRSEGRYRTQEYGIVVRAIPRYLSGFALVVNGDIPQGFFSQGSVVDGPVHANGRIFFDSVTPDSTGDPWIESVSTTSGGGFVFADAGISDVPHPEGSRTWVRPWTRHSQGKPFWSSSQEIVDMPLAAAELAAAAGRGTVIQASRVLLDGQRAIFRQRLDTAPETLSLSGVGVLSVQALYGSVVVKSLRPLTVPLTVFCRGDMVIGGPISGGLAGHGGPLGLVATGDIIVENDPASTGVSDWERPWHIETGSSFVIRAFLAAPTGRFRARSSLHPSESARITIHGGLAVNSFQWVSSGMSGYTLGIAMDPGLVYTHPPGFPQVWRWTPVSWSMNVNMEGY